MKVAVYSESSADEAALPILVEAVLGVPIEALPSPHLRHRGWPAVRQRLANTIAHTYYQTDADILVVVVDSDKTVVHLASHDVPGGQDASCRLCLLREADAKGLAQLKAISGRAPLRLALGLAIPSIEAWFRCGLDPHVTEANWLQGQQAGKWPYTTSELKKAVYGTEHPGLPLETLRMQEEATRLAQNIAALETWFPNGFGVLARDLRKLVAGP